MFSRDHAKEILLRRYITNEDQPQIARDEAQGLLDVLERDHFLLIVLDEYDHLILEVRTTVNAGMSLHRRAESLENVFVRAEVLRRMIDHMTLRSFTSQSSGLDYYHDALEAERQSNMEEHIAQAIYHHIQNTDNEDEFCDTETSVALSKIILKMVLREFRLDLFSKEE